MIERVRVENSRSRPRSSVTLATTATRIAGTAAITENRPTIWTCSRAAALPAPPRLHDVPDLAADDAEQQQHRERVDPEQGDDHVVGRGDRRQVGQHHEGREGRQQRHADRRRPEQAGRESCRFGRRLGSLRGQRVSNSDRGHELPTSPLAPRRKSSHCGGRAAADAFLQQCCRIGHFRGSADRQTRALIFRQN